MTEIQLDQLKESNEFLNKVLQNINTALFLVDEEVKVSEFNDAFQILFSQDRSQAIGRRCGNVIGCSFAVDEKAECGKSSHCDKCAIRSAIVKALSRHSSTYKELLNRDFVIAGKRLNKHLQFSTQYLDYHDNSMALVMIDDVSELQQQKLALEEKQRLIEEDLKAAAGIQHCLLPDIQAFPERVRWAWEFEPCHQIGGDIFNVMTLDDRHAALYMLDISGHGVPSALVTVSVSQSLSVSGGLVKDRKGNITPPRQVIEALDHEYPMERFSKTFTIFYGILDVMDMRLTYCNAGHPAPVVVRAGGGLEMLEATGTLVGLGGLIPFEESRIQLNGKDKLIFYSDGIIERHGPENELYGQDRMLNMVTRQLGQGIEAMLQAIYRDVLDFGGGQEAKDDLSLLGLEIIV